MLNDRLLSKLVGCLFLATLAGCAGNSPKPPKPPGAPTKAKAPDAGSAKADDGFLAKMLHMIGMKDSPSEADKQAVHLKISTSEKLNAAASQQALALSMKVYTLRSRHGFEKASFDDFLDDATIEKQLGETLINDDQMLLNPGKTYANDLKLPADARYIGFVALFRDPVAHRWRFLYDVADSTNEGITLGVHACALTSASGALLSRVNAPPNSLASIRCHPVSS